MSPAVGRPFARLPRWAAAMILVLLAASMAWAALAATRVERVERARGEHVEAEIAHSKGHGDLALYSRIAARIADGQNYYPAAIDEHRNSNYPTRPFVTVRQPTLAWLQAAIGVGGVRYLEMGLVLACLLVLNVRLAALVSLPERLAALVLMTLCAAAVSVPLAGLIHELWAGLWLTLALLIYRPERWWRALFAAAAAIAVRELAVPFVLLWLAFALGQRRWREAAALAGLLALFGIGMALHANAVEALRLAGDPASQGWSGLAGYGLPLLALARLTGLLVLLPVNIAAPIAVLPLVGWLGLGGRLGLFAGLWFAGLATMIALFARPENFYWAQIGLPAYGIGLAFVPRALAELVSRAARQT